MEIITNLLIPGFGVGEMHPTGLASHGGILYMVGQSTARLYTLNPDNGLVTSVGPDVSEFGVGARKPIDIASHDGTLYMVDRGERILYALDTETGCAKEIISLPPDERPFGVASHEGKLYLLTWQSPGTAKSAGIIKVSLDSSSDPLGPRRPLTGAQITPSGLFSYGSGLLLGSNDGLYRVNTDFWSVAKVWAGLLVTLGSNKDDAHWRMDTHNGVLRYIGWRQPSPFN